MAYEAKPTQYGTYEIFKDGSRIATGSASILQNYGLSTDNLKGLTPTASGAPSPASPSTYNIYTTPVDYGVVNKQAPALTEDVYTNYRQQVASGALTAEAAKNALQGLINSNQYSGFVDTNRLFPVGYEFIRNGDTYAFDTTGMGTAIKKTPTILTTNISGAGTSAITPGAMTPAKNLDIANTVPTTPSSATNATILAGSGGNYTQNYQQLLQAKNTTQGQYDALSQEISKLLGTTVGRGQAQLDAESAQNIPVLKTQLNDINGQINQKLAEFKAYSTDVEGKPITLASIQGDIAQKRNVVASDIGLLQARAQALTGQIALAQDLANRSVDLKYQDATDLVNIKIKQLALIKDDLTTKEKAIADQLTKDNAMQSKLLEIAIANEKDKNTTLLNLIQNYPDANISLQDTIESANRKITSSSKIYQDKVKEVGVGGTTTDRSGLMAYAQQYASTGKIPTGLPKGTFGEVAELAKALPKAPGQILDRATGITPDTLGAAGDAYAALYSAIELSNQLAELDKKRVGGLVSGTLGKIFGAADQQKYVDLRDQIVDLLARARSGAALTVTEEERYSGMLPSRFSNPLFLGADSQTRIGNFTSALSSDLKNKTNAKGWAVNGLSTVNLGGKEYVVGQIIDANGRQGRVLADGTIMPL